MAHHYNERVYKNFLGKAWIFKLSYSLMMEICSKEFASTTHSIDWHFMWTPRLVETSFKIVVGCFWNNN
jgi:hypothetical protein